jgi:hypothetical protein
MEKCAICDKDLGRQKRFCSIECKKKSIEEQRKISDKRNTRLCIHCGEPYVAKRKVQKFCSYRCKYHSTRRAYELVCKNCGKTFYVHNITHTKKKNNYCSTYCQKKKYTFREPDFTIQNAENMYWLGFMFGATTELREEWIILEDSKEMLKKFNDWIGGNMPITEDRGYFSLRLFSRQFVKHMIYIGLKTDYYKEAPLIENIWIKDFIRGYFDTGNGFIYKDEKRPVVAIHGLDSKLMRYFADMLNAKLTYKNKEWVVVSFDFHMSCIGYPRNEKKWTKFHEKQTKKPLLIPLYKMSR